MSNETEFKGTPGPWYVEELTGIAVCRIHTSDSDADGSWLSNIYDETSWERCKANARLIAAAPELLEALQAAREAFALRGLDRDEAQWPHPPSLIPDIDAAMAKALGNQADIEAQEASIRG